MGFTPKNVFESGVSIGFKAAADLVEKVCQKTWPHWFKLCRCRVIAQTLRKTEIEVKEIRASAKDEARPDDLPDDWPDEVIEAGNG